MRFNTIASSSALIACTSSSLVAINSCIPTRPLYPLPPQLGQPSPLARGTFPAQPRARCIMAASLPPCMCICRHDLQTRRIRRCAQTQTSEAEIINGSTPISVSRETVVGASLVCKVLNNMCPVKAASTAMPAVSLSRISPTKMTSGS